MALKLLETHSRACRLCDALNVLVVYAYKQWSFFYVQWQHPRAHALFKEKFIAQSSRALESARIK